MKNIISDIFSDDELKIKSNITFEMIVIMIMLDLNYQRDDINSIELDNRMENWLGTP